MPRKKYTRKDVQALPGYTGSAWNDVNQKEAAIICEAAADTQASVTDQVIQRVIRARAIGFLPKAYTPGTSEDNNGKPRPGQTPMEGQQVFHKIERESLANAIGAQWMSLLHRHGLVDADPADVAMGKRTSSAGRGGQGAGPSNRDANGDGQQQGQGQDQQQQQQQEGQPNMDHSNKTLEELQQALAEAEKLQEIKNTNKHNAQEAAEAAAAAMSQAMQAGDAEATMAAADAVKQAKADADEAEAEADAMNKAVKELMQAVQAKKDASLIQHTDIIEARKRSDTDEGIVISTRHCVGITAWQKKAGASNADTLDRLTQSWTPEQIGKVWGHVDGADVVVDRRRAEEMPRAVMDHAEAIRAAITNSPGHLMDFPHEALPQILDSLQLMQRSWIVGPTGSGKTYAAKQAAAVLGLRCGLFSCNEETMIQELIGHTDANGQSHMGTLLDYFANGGLWIGDEADKLDPGVIGGANAIFNMDDEIDVPGFGTVKRHPDFRLVLTSNSWGNGSHHYKVQEHGLDLVGRFEHVGAQMLVGFSHDVERNIMGEGGAK